MIGVRRLFAVAVHVSVGLGATAVLANCSGGARPPPADDEVDASVSVGDAGLPSIVGYDPTQGILFGDNGFVNCGTQAGAQTITLKNPTGDTINFTANLTVGADKYKVTPPSGGVPALGSIDIQIQPAPVPAVSDVVQDLYAGTLAIKFADEDTPINIRLHQTARGAILTHSFTGDAFDFGDVKVNTSSPKTFSLTNAGNLDVTANLQLGNPLFTVDGATIASVPLGGGKTVSKTLAFGPVALVPSTDTLAITFNTSAVQCGKPPNNVSLKGNGTSSVGVQPGTLNFGKVNCGGPAAGPQTVAVTSTIALNFTPQLGQGDNSSYTIANDANGQTLTLGNPIALAANGTYTIRVVPKPVPIPSPVANNGLSDTLTITTDAAQDTQPHVVTLNETAQGAIFALSPQQINQGGAPNAQLNVPFSLINSGNASAPYSISISSNGPSGSFTTNLPAPPLTGNAATGNTGGLATLTMPTSNGASYTGTISVAAPGAVLCSDLPPSIPVTATATGTAITTVPSSLDFGFVDCGTAAAPQKITITSIATADITPTFSAGASTPFILQNDADGSPAPNPIHILAGGQFVLRVVPKQIPIPSPIATRQLYPTGVGDVLTLTSMAPGGGPVDPPKTIRIDQTAQGAVFSFNPNTVNKTGTVTLTNNGNATGAWTLTGTGGLANPASGTLGVAPLNQASIGITASAAGSLSLASTTAVCSTLPTVTLTNN
jgi:hypothetical protein